MLQRPLVSHSPKSQVKPPSTVQRSTSSSGDVIGREWQLGTIQVDYNLPERFDLTYVGSDNERHRPVMIHRAPFGSWERFIGVLIEHFAGAFPTWLAPEQACVLPVSEKSAEYAHTVYDRLRSSGVRVTLDDSSERLQARIRTGSHHEDPLSTRRGPPEMPKLERSASVPMGSNGILALSHWTPWSNHWEPKITTRGERSLQKGPLSRGDSR